MKKKILSTTIALTIILSQGIALAEEAPKNIQINDEVLYLYPSFAPLKTEFTSADMVNNIIPLGEEENAITVSLTNTKENEIFVMSVYDITDKKYITSNKGVAITEEKFTIKGLIGGHEYKVNACALFNETSVNGTITTGYIE